MMDPDFFRAQVRAATGKDPEPSALQQALDAFTSRTQPTVLPAPPLASAMPQPVVDTTQAPMPGSDDYTNHLRDMIVGQSTAANNQYNAAMASLGSGSATARNMQEAANAQMQAASDAGVINQKYAQQEADMQGEAAAKMKEQAAEDDAAERQHQSELEQARKRALMASDIATQAEVKDFWHDKSTGSRILGVIAQTLAGAANGLAGTPGAPSALDRIIDQDFERQKSNIANKRDAAYRAEGALSQLVNTYKDEREGKIAARVAAYKMVETKGKQLAAQMKGELEPSRVDAFNAGIQQRIDENLQELDKHKATVAQAAQNNSTDAAVRLAGQEAMAAQLGATMAHRNMAVPGLDGEYDARYLSAESRTKLASYSEIFNNLDGYERDLIHDDKAFRAYAGTITGNALTEGGIRKILGTGAALNAAELKAVQSFTLNFLKGQSLASLSPDLRKQFFAGVRRSLARSYGGFVKGTIPNARFTMDDSPLGRANKLNAEDDAAAARR